MPSPVTAYIPHPIEFDPEDFPQQQFGQDHNSETYGNSEEFLRYPSYEAYLDCYIWPDLLPFDTFNYLDELPIPQGENIFGNKFGNPILDMEDFILELPIPEDENIFGNLFGDYILLDGWDNNWDEEIELEPN